MSVTAEQIERNPALATEYALAWLVDQVVEVHEYEGADLGGYDYNLQSYYQSEIAVSRNAAVFEAIRAIARHNPAALTAKVREQVRRRSEYPIDLQVTSRDLHAHTSYLSNTEGHRAGEQLRNQILGEVLALFAPS